MPGIPWLGAALAPMTGGTSLLATALPSLIEGGMGLLGGLFAGKEKENERKRAMEDWRTKRSEISSSLKPEYSRYSPEKDYGTFDNLLKKLLMGGLSESFGGDRSNDWGIDFKSLISGLGEAKNPTYTSNPTYGGSAPNMSAPPGAPGGAGQGLGPGGNRGRLGADVDGILRKYGMGAQGQMR